MKMRLFEVQSTQQQIEYATAMTNADMILPDGIALQMFDRCTYKHKENNNSGSSWLKNLNGTDFVPYLLKYLLDKWSVSVYVRSVFDEKMGKDESRMYTWISHLQQTFENLHFPFAWQCSYHERASSFPYEDFKKAWQNDTAEYKIFRNGTGTPFQEIRAHKNKSLFMDYAAIVLQLGGTLDYWSGFETRAPSWIVKARVLETPRRIFKNPHKNLTKFLSMFGIIRYIRNKFFW